jgi:GT2 family glycosyltransferase
VVKRTFEPKVSIVVINAKSVKNLENSLTSIVKKTSEEIDYELIVIDCCTPNFVQWIENFKSLHLHTKIKYIHYDTDIGPAEEHNRALRIIRPDSEYILFLDDDTEILEDDWVRNLINPLLEDNSVAVVNPLTVDLNMSNTPQFAGSYLLPDMQSYISTLREAPNKNTFEIFYLHGAVFAIKRKVLDELTKFGLPMYYPFFFIWSDDVDLSIRLRLRNYKILLSKTVRVGHKSGVANALSPFRIYHFWKNVLSTLFLNYKYKSTIARVILFTILWQFVYFIRRLVTSPMLLISIIKSYLWFFKNINLLRQYKIHVNKYRLIDDKCLISKMCKLIFDNKVTFSRYNKGTRIFHRYYLQMILSTFCRC